ncbi:MAG TPA: GNAT family protein [Acidimicrobiales bacterium]|nr:GNAT family protein [Acidimicrobiales bacterium]
MKPKVVARGKRVRLVVPDEKQLHEFLGCVAESRELHGEWVGPPSTPAGYRAYVQRLSADEHHGFFVRENDGDEALVGVVNVNNIVRGAFESGYLGYYGFAGGVGRGLMTEGLSLVIDHSFKALSLHRLEANIQPGNEPSKALVKRLGFRNEGYSPQYLRISGAWRDHERWAILAPEWADWKTRNS